MSIRLANRLRSRVERIGLLVFSGLLIVAGLALLVPVVSQALSGPFWFFTKVVALFYVMVWLRGTLPRFRYDQLMNIGWKVLIPLGLAAVLVNAVVGALLIGAFGCSNGHSSAVDGGRGAAGTRGGGGASRTKSNGEAAHRNGLPSDCRLCHCPRDRRGFHPPH